MGIPIGTVASLQFVGGMTLHVRVKIHKGNITDGVRRALENTAIQICFPKVSGTTTKLEVNIFPIFMNDVRISPFMEFTFDVKRHKNIPHF